MFIFSMTDPTLTIFRHVQRKLINNLPGSILSATKSCVFTKHFQNIKLMIQGGV
jgi:hypothetical protein